MYARDILERARDRGLVTRPRRGAQLHGVSC